VTVLDDADEEPDVSVEPLSLGGALPPVVEPDPDADPAADPAADPEVVCPDREPEKVPSLLVAMTEDVEVW